MQEEQDEKFNKSQVRNAKLALESDRNKKNLLSSPRPGKVESSDKDKLFLESETKTKLMPQEAFIQTYSYYLK